MSLSDRIRAEQLRCRRAEETRDCPNGHVWREGRAYHLETTTEGPRWRAIPKELTR